MAIPPGGSLHPRERRLAKSARPMTLTAGTRLGAYEIGAALGAGGMVCVSETLYGLHPLMLRVVLNTLEE
jgi:hypothetical protein